MKKPFYLAILLSLFCSPLFAVEKQNPQTNINTILRSIKSKANLGFIVSDVKTGRVIFSERSQFLFSPASTQKLFTAVAALYYLGSDYQFTTALLTNGAIKGQTLQGNLTLKFSGDPELTTEDLNRLIEKLKELGIHRISGHVYIDNTAYNDVPYPPGWMLDDLSYGYAAPVSAIIINRNKFLLHILPAKKGNAQPTLSPILPAGVAHFSNRVRTTAHQIKQCPLTVYSDNRNNYQLAGCINRAWGQQRRTLAIRNPVIYANVLLKQALADNVIQYQGPILLAGSSANDVVLAEQKSPPLRHMLKEMLKNSDNLTTDSLLKKMGERFYKKPGTWQNGLHALKKILEPTGIDFKNNLINDGAGLSRYNLVSPDQMAKLLRFAYNQKTIRDPLLKALPIGGKDGTLAGRMRSIANSERVHAKTGSMAGVSALAGYLRTRQNKVLSFAIMINGFVGETHAYSHLEDRLCEFLVKFSERKHG
ncbi:D-alanyl-D-alanine carboxypeptidase/D-alanyl-D-alanine-endopeptidase [Coxiella burnetii]|uniref:D-alanyl-meso-diaminopimelate endopeptidase n=1 Tax=Coxiella burnetii (strain RSA 493 / Nine Mile phase I) TaxID=227377 RepID=Q83FD1_COXBU|nr:D-alanyl-D-alanine carboxypeptidase/D-alanyl-D-alanine-endopeptidase [Coxiella burnetii]NP_819065.1 D-alanyl-meso-diaminopimelate endopeptidase [Coxiella burnetii RSA 493]AAO89579.1 D-alanyl-meso-diaminopimelate endopeptidase [Coxiella burnetii RSA 493]ARI64939.1 D-alanyl-D-alanine carboxypeptidase/D-alanyl-D-alanine-endopeptidase [Coxiella burnetii]ARK26445.1 D-alanyl-D-alanine carboxypeptidase/D-alanyl-D-alanine-endopeptidase [Coxiella burnetii]MCF2094367.1 D-alanyl-D-alanine carboxypepti